MPVMTQPMVARRDRIERVDKRRDGRMRLEVSNAHLDALQLDQVVEARPWLRAIERPYRGQALPTTKGALVDPGEIRRNHGHSLTLAFEDTRMCLHPADGHLALRVVACWPTRARPRIRGRRRRS